MKGVKVKNCPFCGNGAELKVRMPSKLYRYCCPDYRCCARGFGLWFKSEDEALEAWNKRADND